MMIPELFTGIFLDQLSRDFLLEAIEIPNLPFHSINIFTSKLSDDFPGIFFEPKLRLNYCLGVKLLSNAR